jgi:phosphomannomutase
MSERITIEELMSASGVRFGTSGARGLVEAMTDRVCAAYTLGLLGALRRAGRLEPSTPVIIGGDRRPSTPRILTAVGAAVRAAGQPLEYAGLLPSPALALAGLEARAVTVMVTGSHIPADRNGMKFTTADGEITKADEEAIRAEEVELPGLFDARGMLAGGPGLPEPSGRAERRYVARYLDALPPGCLSGLRLGVYGHSAVGRELLVELYGALGATVVRLGFSEEFVPVDTEAIRPEDVELARGWAKEHRLDALVSTDGDSDRPLLADEHGVWLRGDVAGIHTARWLGADGVATPVSSNGALELSGAPSAIARTRIGSPFVIEGMKELAQRGATRVVGYEANGGFLQLSPLTLPGGGELAPLPTRDPVIVHLALLLSARAAAVPVSRLAERLPRRVTASGRDEHFATERSRALLARLSVADDAELAALLELGPVAVRSELDGLRVTFASGEVLHLRPSGNAPELRCYAEAPDEARAEELVRFGLARAQSLG